MHLAAQGAVVLLLVLGSVTQVQGTEIKSIKASSRGLKALSVSFAPESWVGEITSKAGKEFGECVLSSTFPSTGRTRQHISATCDDGLSCIPVLTTPLEPSRSLLLERAGVCVEFPGGKNKTAVPGTAYIFDSLQDIPVPIGYFPLTHENTDSWPFPTFEGTLDGQKYVKDEIFGSVLSCKEGVVTLPSIPYAASGQFSVNFWIKAGAPGEGIGFEYVFSHMKYDARPGIRGDSQVQIYLPRRPLPAYGVLRAVVKDSNDLNKGAASDVFVDSDGEVGNNSERDFDETSHADLYDGKWHMVTVTSRGTRKKGFMLYVDGKLSGELGDEAVENEDGEELQVTGGDPIELDGEIHLCGRALDSTDRFFEGSLAHLAVFNKPLSAENVQELYRQFFSTQSQVNGLEKVHKGLKMSLSGTPCIFPALFGGEWVEECVPLEDTQECQTGPGTWEECSFFASEFEDNFQTFEHAEASERVFVTVDGDPCKFPIYYGGILHHECINIYGVPSCMSAAHDGVWKECKVQEESSVKKSKKASKVKRVTVQGDACVFPFEYLGVSYDDCTSIAGMWGCQIATGEYAPCAVERDPQTLYAVNPNATVISRMTVSGDMCFFPFWYGEESIGDCFPQADVPSCPSIEGGIEPCTPLRITVEGQPCAIPFFYNDTIHYDCAEIEGSDRCMMSDGEFDICAPHGSVIDNYVGDPKLHVITARVTKTDENCAFPFWYGGQLVSDCVPEGGSEFCRTTLGLWEECMPQRLTTSGKKCSIPFQEEEVFYFDCMFRDGTFMCPTAFEEPWGECAGDFAFPPGLEPGDEGFIEDQELDNEVQEVEEAIEVEHSARQPEGMDTAEVIEQDEFPAESWIGELSGKPGQAMGLCRLNSVFQRAKGGEDMPECEGGLSCVPVLTPSRNSRTAGLQRVGACVEFPGIKSKSPAPVGAYIFDPVNKIPLPMGYFPLTHGEVNSWPFPSYEGKLHGQKFVNDNLFGSVLQCKKGTVELPSISYAASGTFSVNLWLRTSKPAKGVGFEYIFSHMRDGAWAGFRDESQIQLYLPREPIPSHGVLRAVVKDVDDHDEGRASDSFVDSDGEVGNNSLRDFGEDHVDFYDGKWHMATVVSPGDVKGFKLYVDGALAGEMGEKPVKVKDGKTTVELQVTGGDPIDLSGKIHLCGRAVDSEQRYFEGKIAHLALFDQALSPEQVSALYETHYSTRDQVEEDPGEENPRTAQSGKPCLFPAVHRGELVSECVEINGQEQCPTGPAVWKECSSGAVKQQLKKAQGQPLTEPQTEVDAEEVEYILSDEILNHDGLFETVDGEECDLPVVYAGKIHLRCVPIGRKPMCHTKGGVWKVCRVRKGTEQDAPAAATTSAAQKPPKKKKSQPPKAKASSNEEEKEEEEEEAAEPVAGEKPPSSTSSDGAEQEDEEDAEVQKPKAKDKSKPKRKRPSSVEEKPKPAKKPVKAGSVVQDPTTIYSKNPGAPLVGRVTVDGEKCYFPFWYGDESIGGCFMQNGRQSCPTRSGGVQPCASLRLTVEGIPCSMPFEHDGEEHMDCIDVDGIDMCRTADGKMRECIPPSEEESKEDDYRIVTARATVKKSNCAFPFWYKGELVHDCVKQGKNEFCQTMLGGWERCAPQKFTVDGKKCSIPFQHQGKFHFDCVSVDGISKCPTGEMEPWGTCAETKSP